MKRQSYLNSVNLNQDTSFPYLVLNVINETSYPRNPGFQVMHWHEDLQFVYVLSGQIEVITLESRFPLSSGEGAFINKNTVHLIKKIGFSHYNSFIFPDQLLKFYPGSPAESIVDCLTAQKSLPVFKISHQKETAPVLHALQKLSAIENCKTDLYPYEVLTGLCTLWLEFCRIAALPQPAPPKSSLEERMSIFLHYIEQHYQETISLQALAESAHVSKSECLRCFKAALQTAPYQYITEYRLSKAAELLQSTTLPISEIALRTGFTQPSHFGKCFRVKTAMSPREYRKIYAQSP